MATNDNNRPLDTGNKRLKGHPEQGKLNPHHEAARLGAHTDDDDIIEPATTADVDETPRFVRYGAAILLGLAFGVGCYIWVDGIPSAPQRNVRVKAAPTEQYFTQMGLYDNPNAKGTIPDPFVSPFEPTLDSDNSDATYYSETAITDNPATSTTGRTEYVAINPVGSKLIYLFKYDSDNVPENPELTAMARMAKHKGLSLDVKAYTDEHGRAVYNQRLSERRARAIGDYLVAHGVPASKVSVHGMGATHAYANEAQDRRAEVVVVRP